jgi:hypothetical protein
MIQMHFWGQTLLWLYPEHWRLLERTASFLFWGSGDRRVLDKAWLPIEMPLEHGPRKSAGFSTGAGLLLIGVFIMDPLWC